MASLSSAINQLDSVIQAKNGAADSQALQLELLDQVEQLMRSADSEEVKAVQPALEKSLTSVMLAGPAPPLRHLIAASLVLGFSRGARTTMYTLVGTLLSWMNNRSSPASSIPSKCATVHLLGELMAAQGTNMVQLCEEAIALLAKTIVAKELPLRIVAAAALSRALEGSGGVPAATQKECLKSLTQSLGERGVPAELKAACLQCAVALATYSEDLWPNADATLEPLCALVTKQLDDAHPPTRAAASVALGRALGMALQHPFRRASAAAAKQKASGGSKMFGSGKMFESSKKAEASTVIEAVLHFLGAPFVAKAATRELRIGIARAYVVLLRGMAQSSLERYSAETLKHCLSLLEAPGGGKQAAACVTHVLRAGLGERLSERGQVAAAGALAAAATASSASELVVLVSLKEAAMLLLSLGSVAVEPCEALLSGEMPLTLAVDHASRAVRLAACQCMWALGHCVPSKLPELIAAQLNKIRSVVANISSKPKDNEKLLSQLSSHAHAAAALASAMCVSSLGAPRTVSAAVLDCSAELASSPIEAVTASAWVLLRSLFSIEPEWMGTKARLSRIYNLWKAVLGPLPFGTVSKDKRDEIEIELRRRAKALSCLADFLRRVPDNAGPVIKQLHAKELSPNVSLLAQCREQMSSLMNASFRAAFLSFRASLYSLLGALPNSILQAKLLQVVMPMVVADIVDPSNTQSSTCALLLAGMLELDDEVLGGGVQAVSSALSGFDAHEEGVEPTRLALSEGAEDECEWLAELRGSHSEEVQALNAAVSLFAKVFRLQTSDVRKQLLSHLGTAAARAIKVEAKEAPKSIFGGGGGGGDSSKASERQPSALVNVCAALLGSLRQLAARPSKSQLSPELAEGLTSVLMPCLADPDPSVRRGAAQSAGLLGRILGGAFAQHLLAACQQRLSEGKLRDEARAGYALAFAHLCRGAGGAGVNVKQCVGMLAELSHDDSEEVAAWAIHSLGLLAAAARADFRPHVNGCLGIGSAIALAEPPPPAATAAAIGKLAAELLGAIAAASEAVVAGSKAAGTLAIMGGRCKVLTSAVCALYPHEERAVVAELRHAQISLQLPALLQTAASASTSPRPLILSALKSKSDRVRLAGLSCLRALVESGGSIGAIEPVLERLLKLMDTEADATALAEAKRVVLKLLDARGAEQPTFWLRLLRGVVQELKKDEADARGGGGGGGDDEDEGEEKEGGGWDQNASGLPAGDSTEDSEEARRRHKQAEVEAQEAKKWERVSPRWQTRLFAVECVRRLLTVQHDPAQFELARARESGSHDRLVLSLQDIVSLAFAASTFPVEAIRPAGLLTMLEVVERFDGKDPDYEGHLLLEQFHAQISAALRPCFTPDATPPVAATGCALTCTYLLKISTTAGGHQVDAVAVRKLLQMLLGPAAAPSLQQLAYPAHSEAAATMVRAATLQALAQLQREAAAAAAARSELAAQLKVALPELRDCWLCLLRDYALVHTQPKTLHRTYRPHFCVPSVLSEARAYLGLAWLPSASAVASMIDTDAWLAGRANAAPSAPAGAYADDTLELEPVRARPDLDDFQLLLGLLSHRLNELAPELRGGADGERGAGAQELEEEASGTLRALKSILLPARYFTPDVLPMATLMRLVALLRTLASSASPSVGFAVGEVGAHLSANLAPYLRTSGGDAAPAISEIVALAAAPLLAAMPHLVSPKPLATTLAASPPPIGASQLEGVKASLAALAKLCASLELPVQRLRMLGPLLLLSLHTAHAACASVSAPPHTELTDTVATVCRALLALGTAAAGSSSECARTWSELLASTVEMALALLDATPAAQRLPLFQLVQLAAHATHEGDEAAPMRLVGALRALLQSPRDAEQLVGLQAVTALLQPAAGGGGNTARAELYMRELLPDVAPLLLRPAATQSTAALKLMLLCCTSVQPAALPTLLSLFLPLLVGCMWTSAQGPPSKEARELSTLAHASFTALAQRAPAEVKQAVSIFSPSTRSRMETAVREKASAASQPAGGAGPVPTGPPPKIALKMDFGGFGKK